MSYWTSKGIRFSKINLRKAWDGNCRMLIQVRITDSLPRIFEGLTEKFPKIHKIFVVMFFGMILTKWALNDIS